MLIASRTSNDGLGHETGDQLLKAVAERLPPVVQQGRAVARRGGDEFTIMLAGMAHVATPRT